VEVVEGVVKIEGSGSEIAVAPQRQMLVVVVVVAAAAAAVDKKSVVELVVAYHKMAIEIVVEADIAGTDWGAAAAAGMAVKKTEAPEL
jgi:hypothetical protein